MAKSLVGTVSSAKTDKTIVVTVATHKTHPIYRKKYVFSKKFMAHDEKNEAKVGDKVLITETRPISSVKRHQLTKVLERPLISEEQTVEAVTETDSGKKPTIKKEEESEKE